jgi:anti-sigma factor RsiW
MAYIDGDLSPAEQAEFDAHLAECPRCVDYLRTYRETIRLGKSAFPRSEASVPQEVPEELVRAILSARAKHEKS